MTYQAGCKSLQVPDPTMDLAMEEPNAGHYRFLSPFPTTMAVPGVLPTQDSLPTFTQIQDL